MMSLPRFSSILTSTLLLSLTAWYLIIQHGYDWYKVKQQVEIITLITFRNTTFVNRINMDSIELLEVTSRSDIPEPQATDDRWKTTERSKGSKHVKWPVNQVWSIVWICAEKLTCPAWQELHMKLLCCIKFNCPQHFLCSYMNAIFVLSNKKSFLISIHISTSIIYDTFWDIKQH